MAGNRTSVEIYYRKTSRWSFRPPRPKPHPVVPADYDVALVSLRRRLGLTPAECARSIGAAGQATVYQWESRKRRPSPVFWQRICALNQGLDGRTDLPGST